MKRREQYTYSYSESEEEERETKERQRKYRLQTAQEQKEREEDYERKKKEYESKPRNTSHQNNVNNLNINNNKKEMKEINQEIIKEIKEKPLIIYLDEDEDEILKKMGLENGFVSTKGKHVKGNINSYCKIRQTSKIFNLLIKKRGTEKKPTDVHLN